MTRTGHKERAEPGVERILARMRPPGAWIHEGSCRTVDPELFFTPADLPAAKAVCRRCPVVDQCLRWALDSREEHGVWGALDQDQRKGLNLPSAIAARRRHRALRAARQQAAAAEIRGRRAAPYPAAPPAYHPRPACIPAAGPYPRAAGPARILGALSMRGTPVSTNIDPWAGQRLKVLVARRAPAPGEPDLRRPLSAREVEVLGLMGLGLSTEQIGIKLTLSPLTVKSHKARIADAIGSRGECAHTVALGYACGYLRPEPLAPSRLIMPNDRPLQVLRLLPEGLANAEIGARLHMAEDTVKTHVRRMFKQYGAASRGHLVGIACHRGMIAVVLTESGQR